MPVETPHPSYNDSVNKWNRCRHTANGSDAVKDSKTLYLPMLEKQDVLEYDAYRMRAMFFGATGRTVQGLLGAVFRKDFNIQYPEYLINQLESITPTSMELKDFARKVVYEQLVVGRVGILVDADKENSDVINASIYTAENIVNWKTKRSNGKESLTLVVLRETYEGKTNDVYESKQKEQYRVLSFGLTEKGESSAYMQTVWRKREGGESNNASSFMMVSEETVVPRIRGVAMDHIPFYFINAESLSSAVVKPPLLDLVDVNLSHYRTSADLEHGAHYTALPTAWLAGFTTDGSKEFRIGSATAWVSEEIGATAGFLEFKGQGLESLRNLKKDKEQLMAVLGARMLEEQKKAVEAADTHRLRQSGESGALTTIADTASEGIENVLQMIARWSGASEAQIEAIKFDLNTDFASARMTPQELTSLMQAWQGGAMSQDTFLHNLKQGEILPDGRTIEEEKDLIAVEAPSGGVTEDEMNNIIPIKRNFKVVKNGDNSISVSEGDD